MEVPQKARNYGRSCCATGLRPGRLRRSIDHGAPSPDRGEDHVCFPGGRHSCRRHHGVMELVPRINGFHLEPRCRVCRNDQVRKKVNDMLAAGASYAMSCAHLGKTTPSSTSVIGSRSTRSETTARTFQSKASPERPTGRSWNGGQRRTGVDFVEGVATALLPMTFFEVVMNKAFRDAGGRSHRGQCGDRPASRREAAVRPRRA